MPDLELTVLYESTTNILRAVLIKITAQNWNMRTIYLVTNIISRNSHLTNFTESIGDFSEGNGKST